MNIFERVWQWAFEGQSQAYHTGRFLTHVTLPSPVEAGSEIHVEANLLAEDVIDSFGNTYQRVYAEEGDKWIASNMKSGTLTVTAIWSSNPKGANVKVKEMR